jgi:hypothetical protein
MLAVREQKKGRMKNRLLSTVFCLGLLASPWLRVCGSSHDWTQEHEGKPIATSSGKSEAIFSEYLKKLGHFPHVPLAGEAYVVFEKNGPICKAVGIQNELEGGERAAAQFINSLPVNCFLSIALVPTVSDNGPRIMGSLVLLLPELTQDNETLLHQYKGTWDPFSHTWSSKTIPLGEGDTLSLHTIPFDNPRVGSTMTRLRRLVLPKGLDLLDQEEASHPTMSSLTVDKSQILYFEELLSQVSNESLRQDLRRLMSTNNLLLASKDFLKEAVGQLALIKDGQMRAQLSRYVDVIAQNAEGDFAVSLLKEIPTFADIEDQSARIALQKSRIKGVLATAVPSIDIVFIKAPEVTHFPMPFMIRAEDAPYWCPSLMRPISEVNVERAKSFTTVALGKTPFPTEIERTHNIAMYVQCLKSPYLKRALEAYAKLTSATARETLKALLEAISDEKIRLALSPFGTPERENELGGLETPQKAGMFVRVMSAILSQNPSEDRAERSMGFLVDGFYKKLLQTGKNAPIESIITSLMPSENIGVYPKSPTDIGRDASSSSSSAQNTSMRFPTARRGGTYILCGTGRLTPEMSMKDHSVGQLLSVIEASDLRYSAEELEKLKTYARQTPYNSFNKLSPEDLVSFLYHKEATLDGLNAITYAIERIRREGNSSTVIDCLDEVTLSLCHYGGYPALKTLGGIKETETPLQIKELLDVETLKKLGKQFAFEKLIAHLAALPDQGSRRRYLAALIENPQDYSDMRAQRQPLQETPVLSGITVGQLPTPYSFYLPKETQEFREHFMASLTTECLEVLRMDGCGTLFTQLKCIENSEVRGRVMRLLTPSLFKSTGDILNGGLVQLLAEIEDPIL